MAKKQTRRSISVSRATYERLKSYCETNGMSMSQFVETRVGDFLGRSIRRPQEGSGAAATAAVSIPSAPVVAAPAAPPAQQTQTTIRPLERRPAPPPTKPTAESIFTF
ncbi:MAG TPA: hypothetical protein VFU21_17120 [Kofleriaceae bacterium]|nr:hypothetical protein [Kofleriaceae bacterium]